MTKKGKLMYCPTSRHEAKIFCFLFSVICIVFLNTPSISAETLKIGVFDIQKVMKESKGKANPAKVNELLKKKLSM